jgi:hypothetical protein
MKMEYDPLETYCHWSQQISSVTEMAFAIPETKDK